MANFPGLFGLGDYLHSTSDFLQLLHGSCVAKSHLTWNDQLQTQVIGTVE